MSICSAFDCPHLSRVGTLCGSYPHFEKGGWGVSEGTQGIPLHIQLTVNITVTHDHKTNRIYATGNITITHDRKLANNWTLILNITTTHDRKPNITGRKFYDLA